MRLIHTADWHLGRRLKGIDRTLEISVALETILQQAKALEVDAVLIAGDIFDIPNPPASAERVAYKFFCGLQEAGIPAVAIAGNHDSAFRIDSLATLLSLAGVRALGTPRSADDGGAILLDTPGGKLCVGALPFAAERRMLDAHALWHQDDIQQRQSYRQIVSEFLENLTSRFRDHFVNILMGHMTIDGARLAHSEVAYYTQDTYALSEETLPAAAQYIALGHIHVHQKIRASSPTFYSGSLVQIDFGEAGQEKGFCLIDVEPGCPAQVEFIPLPCQRPLKIVRCNAETLDDTLASYQYDPSFLKVVVELESPILGLADRVRRICPHALQIQPFYPEGFLEESEIRRDPHHFDPVTEFHGYYRDRLGKPPTTSVVEEFEKLYKQFKEKNPV